MSIQFIVLAEGKVYAQIQAHSSPLCFLVLFFFNQAEFSKKEVFPVTEG